MQVKPILAPREAERSEFGNRFFLADSREIATTTHEADLVAAAGRGWPLTEQSAWIAIPFGREVLVAAGMTAIQAGWTGDDIADLDADTFREWVLGAYMSAGSWRVKGTIETDEFQDSYAGHDLAECFALISRAVDAAFGFDPGPAPVPTQVPCTQPARPARATRPRALAGIHRP